MKMESLFCLLERSQFWCLMSVKSVQLLSFPLSLLLLLIVLVLVLVYLFFFIWWWSSFLDSDILASELCRCARIDCECMDHLFLIIVGQVYSEIILQLLRKNTKVYVKTSQRKGNIWYQFLLLFLKLMFWHLIVSDSAVSSAFFFF